MGLELETAWVQDRLGKAFPACRGKRECDFNGDGKIEEHEKLLDYDKDGKVGSAGDWVKYCQLNLQHIQRKDPFFEWGIAFSADNPIHSILNVVSTEHSSQEIREAYLVLTTVLEAVKHVLKVIKEELKDKDLCDHQKLIVVYAVLDKLGFNFKDKENLSFVESFRRKTVDCDTSALIFIALAHELGWPVYAMKPYAGHVALRWDDGKANYFNIERPGFIVTDAYYTGEKKADPKSIKDGVFMRNLSFKELLGLAYMDRATLKNSRGAKTEAVKDYETARGLYPQNTLMHFNLAQILGRMGKDNEAMPLYKLVIELDPLDSEAHLRLGQMMLKKNKYWEAKQYFEKVIELKPEDPIPYMAMIVVSYALKDPEKVIYYQRRVAELKALDNKKLASLAYGGLGIELYRAGSEKEAADEFLKALILNPENRWLGLYLTARNILPGVDLGVQGMVDNNRNGGVLSTFGLRWRLTSGKKPLRLHFRPEIGYAWTPGHHALDLAGNVQMEFKKPSWLFTGIFEAGAGYRFSLSGKGNEGAFIKYGPALGLRVQGLTMFRLKFMAQHLLSSPRDYSFTIGPEFIL